MNKRKSELFKIAEDRNQELTVLLNNNEFGMSIILCDTIKEVKAIRSKCVKAIKLLIDSDYTDYEILSRYTMQLELIDTNITIRALTGDISLFI